ncbi:kinase-like domain-containing protein [Hyaloraphidium curvatum]|nr:kinase-like domain-containing protein [Hyaloraphidium curvatum]
MPLIATPSPTEPPPFDDDFAYPRADAQDAAFLSVPRPGAGLADDAPHYDTPSLPRRFTKITHGAYKVGRKLGEGQLAVVREAVNIETGLPFALKILPIDNIRGREHRVKTEIDVLRKISLGHPNVIQLYDCFTDHKNLFLVTDLCTGGDLWERVRSMGPYTEDQARDILRVVAQAVKYLHEAGVVHRDIKAENILFRGSDTTDPGNVVIADFGLSRLFSDGTGEGMRTMCGTPGWMAPEVVTGSGEYGKEVDLWGVGVLAYFLLSAHMPFESDNHLTETMNVALGRYDLPDGLFGHVSDLAKDFIRRLLVVAPALRMTADGALAHPFLNFASAQRLIMDQQRMLEMQDHMLSALVPGTGAEKVSLADLMDQLQVLSQQMGSPSSMGSFDGMMEL